MYGDFTASVKFLAPIAPKYTLNIDWNGVASEDDIFIAELYECDTTSDVGTSVASVSLKPDTNSTNFDGYELISDKYYYVKVKDNSVKDGYKLFWFKWRSFRSSKRCRVCSRLSEYCIECCKWLVLQN